MLMFSGILVKSGDKVLMCKRCSECSLPNKWTIPSGHVEKGETTVMAAHREFFEETNLKVGDLKLIGMFKSNTGEGLVYVYFFESKNEIIPDLLNAKDGREHSECGYFKLDEIKYNDTTPELYELIKKVLL